MAQQKTVTDEMKQQGYVLQRRAPETRGEYLIQLHPEFSDERMWGRPIALPDGASEGVCDDTHFYFFVTQKRGPTAIGAVDAVLDLFSNAPQVRSRTETFRVALPH